MFLINTNKIIIKIASLFSFLSLKAISGSINMTFPCFLHTAQKMKFSIKDFFSKCDQIQVRPVSCSMINLAKMMRSFKRVYFNRFNVL